MKEFNIILPLLLTTLARPAAAYFTTSSDTSDSSTITTAAGIGVFLCILIALLMCCSAWQRKLRRKQRAILRGSADPELGRHGGLRIVIKDDPRTIVQQPRRPEPVLLPLHRTESISPPAYTAPPPAYRENT